MSLLTKFDETGREIGTEDVPIDDTNLALAIDQYGMDWVQGYKACFADFMKQLDKLVTRNDQYIQGGGVSEQVAGTRVKKLRKEKSLTLEKMIQLLSVSKLQP